MASPSRPRPIPSNSPSHTRTLSSPVGSYTRSASNARLASPVPTPARSPRPSVSQPTNTIPPLPGLDGPGESRSAGQPGASALTSALSASLGRSPTRAPPLSQGSIPRSSSFADRNNASLPPSSFHPGSHRSHRTSRGQSPSGQGREDFSVVRRHLVGPADSQRHVGSVPTSFPRAGATTTAQSNLNDDLDVPDLSEGFSSLQMKGGDVHRGIYRRTEAEETAKRRKPQRSQSVEIHRQDLDAEEMNAGQIREPGGFRREHLLRTQPGAIISNQVDGGTSSPAYAQQRSIFTSNFFEFLTIYGHFAGEEYEEDETDSGIESSAVTVQGDDPDRDDYSPIAETRPLLKRQTTAGKHRRREAPKTGAGGTIMILLKSFVGTGVLFLPRAFLNGGMAFSIGILLGVAALSYYCFLLLTTSRAKLGGSYAEMGEVTMGTPLRRLINTSLVLSQIGFTSAYIVFTSENLQGFVLAVSKGETLIDIKLMILMQLVIFLPLSLYRNLNNLSYIVYIADLFIVLGLIYLYYYDVATIVEYGLADIHSFNKQDWTLFIGTAIFTFEGIGLIIPIQDGMRRPEKFSSILLLCMFIMGAIFISMGAMSYAAFGSETQTVIIKNMRQDNKFVNGVQFMYSLAILLSTPMQIFPVITILEKGLFARSGKHSKNIKWGKNIFRFALVVLCALIAWVGANDLDKFVALVGSFACIPLVYIYPALIHRRAVSDSWKQSTIDILICIFGFVLMAYTTVLTVASWIGGSKGHEGSRMINS